jgi:hypothetical protein
VVLIDSMLGPSTVDRRFEPHSGQTKVYAIGMCCLSANHAALRRKCKYWLARNQNNVSEWCKKKIEIMINEFFATDESDDQIMMVRYYWSSDTNIVVSNI